MNLPTVKPEEARLLLMGAQGLLEDPERAATHASLARLVERMGFVQLDSINVVERAHHLTLASRLDGYRAEHLSRLLERDRRLFEHWTHDASAVPTKWFAHWKPRFESSRVRILDRSSWWRQRMGDGYGRVVKHVRERIGREGPLRSQDFEHERRDGAAGWWEWKPQKAALEFLWRTGELTIVRREGFQKVYDLTERALPEQHAAPRPTEQEHIEWACSTALERLVVATPKELSEFWDAIDIESAKGWCETAAREGRVTPVMVESLDGSKPRAAFAVNDWKRRLSKLPAPPARTRLLSPFDPVLRDRARARRLFGFDYRFEAFVPGPKRVHGYYVLPVLEGDRLVARLDPKFERREGLLKVHRVYWEPSVRVTRQRRKELERALARLAAFIGAEKFSLPDD
jgi:uncharacterized protein YcaQ